MKGEHLKKWLLKNKEDADKLIEHDEPEGEHEFEGKEHDFEEEGEERGKFNKSRREEEEDEIGKGGMKHEGRRRKMQDCY